MATVSKREWIHPGSGEKREAWVVRYTDNLGRRRLKTFERKKEADYFRGQVDTGQVIQNQLTAKAKPFGEALDAWLNDIERRHQIREVSGNYRASMNNMVSRHVRPALGAIRLHDLSRDHVQDWLDKMIVEFSKETVKHAMIPVHGALKIALRKKWIARNPLVDDPVKVGNKPAKPRVIPTKEQISHLLQLIATRSPRQSERSWERGLLIFTLGLFQGMRIGEICGLQWSDVDLERDIIFIRHSLSRFDGLKPPKTAAGVRKLPLSPPSRAVFEMLKKSASYGPASGHVYRSNAGKPVIPDRARIDTFYNIMKRAGLTEGGKRGAPMFTLHGLRHAALSMLAEQGMPPLHLKALAGHKSIQTTMDIYGHLFPSDAADRRVMGETAANFAIPALAARPAALTEDEARMLTAGERWRLRQEGVDVPMLRAGATRAA